jgi:hypothetical protein
MAAERRRLETVVQKRIWQLNMPAGKGTSAKLPGAKPRGKAGIPPPDGMDAANGAGIVPPSNIHKSHPAPPAHHRQFKGNGSPETSLLSNARNRWRRASDDTSRAIRLKLADHGSPLRFILCAALIVVAKVIIYPSLTTAVQPIGSGGIDFVGCALIGDLSSVLLHPFDGYLATLPRLIVEALGSLIPQLYLPQAFYWLSLIAGALFCSLLVLPQFAVAMPSVSVRIGAALFLGTYPDYAANLPENIAVLGFIPLLWLGLVAGESKNWSTVLLAATGGVILMLSKPILLIAAPAFVVAAIIAAFQRNARTTAFHVLVTLAASLQIAYMAALGSLPRVIDGIHQLGGQPLANGPAKDALLSLAGTIGRIVDGGRAVDAVAASSIAAAVFAVLVIAAIYTLRHARTRADFVWIFGSALLILIGALAATVLTTAHPVLPIVIAITIAFATLQPFERITWARRTSWVIGLVLLAGTAGNLPQSHDPIDPAKGYSDWERANFLTQDEHFAIPVDADDTGGEKGPALWLMENDAGFLNSDGAITHGRPKPLGSRDAADFPVDLSSYQSQGMLGAIVPLHAGQAGKTVEMEVIDAAGVRKKASLGIPLPNGSRYFLFDRPIGRATALHFSVGGSPEAVSPAIALIGESPKAPKAESVCAMPAFFRLKGH